jgi:nicotinate-nucleotide pyrophosphorylase (carboxylating)
MNNEMKKIIQMALREDIPTEDISSIHLFTAEISTGKFIAKESGVISGIEVCKEVFNQVDKNTVFTINIHDGESVEKGNVIAEVKGLTKSILAAERVGLNFLQRMSGVASLTRKFVDEIIDYPTKILDTRKTTPLLRAFEKKAVVDGGGTNHRLNLSDMVMLKDNHLKAAKSIESAVTKVRAKVGNKIKIEVEVERIEQFKEALNSDCDIIMLDNMSNDLMRECVNLNKGKKLLEASGNMNIERLKEVAKTGVDYISVGLITHSYPALDISLKF